MANNDYANACMLPVRPLSVLNFAFVLIFTDLFFPFVFNYSYFISTYIPKGKADRNMKNNAI